MYPKLALPDSPATILDYVMLGINPGFMHGRSACYHLHYPLLPLDHGLIRTQPLEEGMITRRCSSISSCVWMYHNVERHSSLSDA